MSKPGVITTGLVLFIHHWTLKCKDEAEWNRRLTVCTDQAPDIVHPFGQLPNHQSHVMQIGISVETVAALHQLTPAAGVSATAVDSYREFCVHMLHSCYNYLASFATARTQLALSGAPNDEFVPLAHLRTWYENFERRLTQNPNFWKSWLVFHLSRVISSFPRSCVSLQKLKFEIFMLDCF